MKGVVLVTGASGFIGRDLVVRLAAAGWRVRAAGRDRTRLGTSAEIEAVVLPDLSQPVDWLPLLEGVTHVVHLAGIAHATNAIPEATYHAVNAGAVASLATAAAQAGVKQIVLMSSVRAQCGATAEGVVSEDRPPRPEDAYGRSKLAGERALAQLLAGTATAWCALRPVVVYGPGVKGNMASLLRLARMPVPLPIGGLAARRSVLGLVNLAAAVQHALLAPGACGNVFLLADPGPLTVPGMVLAMRRGLGRPPGMVTVPLSPLRVAAQLAGRRAAWDRIAGELVVSTARLEAGGWRPGETSGEGIARWMREAAGAVTVA
jgi:UDP-glucose 4-epimerase